MIQGSTFRLHHSVTYTDPRLYHGDGTVDVRKTTAPLQRISSERRIPECCIESMPSPAFLESDELQTERLLANEWGV